MLQVGIHLEIDVLRNFNDTGNSSGVCSCSVGSCSTVCRSRHEIIQIKIIGMNVQRSFQRSTFQDVADIIFETTVGGNVIFADVDGCFT